VEHDAADADVVESSGTDVTTDREAKSLGENAQAQYCHDPVSTITTTYGTADPILEFSKN
jgi:hypothetical protein